MILIKMSDEQRKKVYIPGVKPISNENNHRQSAFSYLKVLTQHIEFDRTVILGAIWSCDVCLVNK